MVGLISFPPPIPTFRLQDTPWDSWPADYEVPFSPTATGGLREQHIEGGSPPRHPHTTLPPSEAGLDRQISARSASVNHNIAAAVSPGAASSWGARLRRQPQSQLRYPFSAPPQKQKQQSAPSRADLIPVGDTRIQGGDVLLLETGPEFVERWGRDPGFLLVSEVQKSQPPLFDKFLYAAGSIFAMLAVYISLSTARNDMNGILLPLSLVTAGFMIAVRVITPAQARRSVNGQVVVSIAAAFGVSAALERTGMAAAIGELLVDAAVAVGSGEIGIITAIYLVTVLLGMAVSNNAAALLVFGVAQTAADQLGIHPHKVLFALMLGASHSFVTPWTYQCNLIVWTVGGYSVREFAKFGALMQLVMLAVSIPCVVLLDSWYLFVGGSFLLLVVVVLWRLGMAAAASSNSAGSGSTPAGSGSTPAGGVPQAKSNLTESRQLQKKHAKDNHEATVNRAPGDKTEARF